MSFLDHCSLAFGAHGVESGPGATLGAAVGGTGHVRGNMEMEPFTGRLIQGSAHVLIRVVWVPDLRTSFKIIIEMG